MPYWALSVLHWKRIVCKKKNSHHSTVIEYKPKHRKKNERRKDNSQQGWVNIYKKKISHFIFTPILSIVRGIYCGNLINWYRLVAKLRCFYQHRQAIYITDFQIEYIDHWELFKYSTVLCVWCKRNNSIRSLTRYFLKKKNMAKKKVKQKYVVRWNGWWR